MKNSRADEIKLFGRGQLFIAFYNVACRGAWKTIALGDAASVTLPPLLSHAVTYAFKKITLWHKVGAHGEPEFIREARLISSFVKVFFKCRLFRECNRDA